MSNARRQSWEPRHSSTICLLHTGKIPAVYKGGVSLSFLLLQASTLKTSGLGEEREGSFALDLEALREVRAGTEGVT